MICVLERRKKKKKKTEREKDQKKGGGRREVRVSYGRFYAATRIPVRGGTCGPQLGAVLQQQGALSLPAVDLGPIPTHAKEEKTIKKMNGGQKRQLQSKRMVFANEGEGAML